MTELTKRATVYLDPALHRALRLKSVETSRSMSDLINDAIRDECSQRMRMTSKYSERVSTSPPLHSRISYPN